MSAHRSTVACLRGAFVGGACTTVSIAAHAVGGGAVNPGDSSVALLMLGGWAVGAMTTAAGDPPRLRILYVMATLAAGQAICHSALTVAPGHSHTDPDVAMLAAHLVAIPLGALLIHTAEQAVYSIMTSVRRVISLLRLRVPSPLSHLVVLVEWDLSAKPGLVGKRSPSPRGPPITGSLSTFPSPHPFR